MGNSSNTLTMANPTTFQPSQYPPFPDGLPEIELQTISLAKLQDEVNRQVEEARLLEICKTYGFFYLDFSGTKVAHLPKDADHFAKLAEEVFSLAVEEKLKYSFQKGTILGYKKKGVTVTDKYNTPDTAEFFNVSKNDFVSPNQSLLWPEVILDRRPEINKFTHTAHETCSTILAALARQLSLEPSVLSSIHRYNEQSTDHIRLTYGPPLSSKDSNELEIQTPAHTDFGTITMLFNWLGGLQLYSRSSRGTDEANVIEPDAGPDETWKYVRPKPNHAIINLGEAAAIFTGGILCAGRHRVLPAPGAQGHLERYSVVYFVRPEDEAIMQSLMPGQQRSTAVAGLKAKDWIVRQAKGLTKNKTALIEDD